MKNLIGDISVAELRSRLEKGISKNTVYFIVTITLLSVIAAAAVTLLIVKVVKTKRFNDWLDDDFDDDEFLDDDEDDVEARSEDDFDIELKKGAKAPEVVK